MAQFPALEPLCVGKNHSNDSTRREREATTTKLSFYQDVIFIFQAFKNGWSWWGILHHVTIPLDCCHHWFFLDQMRPEGGYHPTT